MTRPSFVRAHGRAPLACAVVWLLASCSSNSPSAADAAGDDAERVIRDRRISFWTACGARLLPAPGYVLPDYTASGTTEPMLLMAATPADAPSVHSDRLRKLVLAIYTDRYGMAADNPLVAQALASITT